MTKRLLVYTAALLLAASLSLISVATSADEGSWNGYVTDSLCAKGGDMAKVKSADCAKMCVKDHGGKWVLYSPDGKKAFTLEGADKLADHAGQYVNVKGTLDGDTIKVKSVTEAKEPAAK